MYFLKTGQIRSSFKKLHTQTNIVLSDKGFNGVPTFNASQGTNNAFVRIKKTDK
jgi:hypothetical protein